jgi:hypothetical protein
MLTYEQFTVLAGLLFFGGLVILFFGLTWMRKATASLGAFITLCGFLTWFWNGVGWYATH